MESTTHKIWLRLPKPRIAKTVAELQLRAQVWSFYRDSHRLSAPLWSRWENIFYFLKSILGGEGHVGVCGSGVGVCGSMWECRNWRQNKWWFQYYGMQNTFLCSSGAFRGDSTFVLDARYPIFYKIVSFRAVVNSQKHENHLPWLSYWYSKMTTDRALTVFLRVGNHLKFTLRAKKHLKST